jgi:hypothetical protein
MSDRYIVLLLRADRINRFYAWENLGVMFEFNNDTDAENLYVSRRILESIYTYATHIVAAISDWYRFGAIVRTALSTVCYVRYVNYIGIQ